VDDQRVREGVHPVAEGERPYQGEEADGEQHQREVPREPAEGDSDRHCGDDEERRRREQHGRMVEAVVLFDVVTDVQRSLPEPDRDGDGRDDEPEDAEDGDCDR